DGPIRLTLRPSTLHVGSPPSLRVTLRSAGAAQVVYPRDDLYSFHIRGPLGEVDCHQSRLPITPIVDLYRRISARRGVSARIGTHACPEAFSVPGVYEVTPAVDLVYGGERYGLEALTGRFEGVPGLVRVVGHGYVAHPLDGTP
ncbi:MAG: hypothetical protein GXP55_05705, partial [Deltaproteobacteria bacterium]|nr:hypothetical protein [Deltaproteobacteria bacterium]